MHQPTKKTRPSGRRKRASTPRTTRFQRFGGTYPEVAGAYEALSTAVQKAGPLDARTQALVKLAIAAGVWREGAVHSHTRRALTAGCSAEEIRHVVVLATTALGFPGMMAVMSWIDDVLQQP